MQIKDLSHPKNSKTLNESMAKKFGYKLNLDSFTLEQLQIARDRVMDKITQFEGNKEFDAVYESNEYHKDRMFLDVLITAISERSLSPGEEQKKEKYFKGMKKIKGDFKKRYGDKGEEVMHATATKMAKKESLEEAMQVLRSALHRKTLREGEEEKAALIMSARDMVDKITGWLEDVASLKSETMLELLDSIRDELGSEVSGQFAEKVKPALDEIYTVLERNRQTLAQAVAIITGEEAPGSNEGAPTPAPGEEMTQTTMGANDFPSGDEFAASQPSAGGTEPAGRAKRESIEYSRRLGILLSSKKN
jgi:hypothetical protein